MTETNSVFLLARFAVLGVLSILPTMAPAASGQYPDRPIRFVVPFPAGGANDIFARVVGEKLGQNLSQQVVIDNRPGGGGSMGAEIAARALPDGYTLLLANTGPNAIDLALRPRNSYDPSRDFSAVTQIASVPLVLAVYAGLPAKSLGDFILAAKNAPGRISYASAGNGSIAHLASELFKSQAGIDLAHIPYKGTPQALTDLISGQVAMLFTTTVASLPYIKSGRLRTLGIADSVRSPLLPDVPTMGQAGLKGFEVSSWYGIVVPVKTPQPVISRLYSETARVLQSPDIRQRFESLGGNPVGSDPAAFSAFLKREAARWAEAVRISGARVD